MIAQRIKGAVVIYPACVGIDPNETLRAAEVVPTMGARADASYVAASRAASSAD